MSNHLNEYLVATHSIDRHRPDPRLPKHAAPRAWRARAIRGRHGRRHDVAGGAPGPRE